MQRIPSFRVSFVLRLVSLQLMLTDEPPGTSQSITGAADLDNILRPSFDVDEIQARLDAWEIPRKERVKFIQGVERKAWPSN